MGSDQAVIRRRLDSAEADVKILVNRAGQLLELTIEEKGKGAFQLRGNNAVALERAVSVVESVASPAQVADARSVAVARVVPAKPKAPDLKSHAGWGLLRQEVRIILLTKLGVLSPSINRLLDLLVANQEAVAEERIDENALETLQRTILTVLGSAQDDVQKNKAQIESVCNFLRDSSSSESLSNTLEYMVLVENGLKNLWRWDESRSQRYIDSCRGSLDRVAVEFLNSIASVESVEAEKAAAEKAAAEKAAAEKAAAEKAAAEKAAAEKAAAEKAAAEKAAAEKAAAEKAAAEKAAAEKAAAEKAAAERAAAEKAAAEKAAAEKAAAEKAAAEKAAAEKAAAERAAAEKAAAEKAAAEKAAAEKAAAEKAAAEKAAAEKAAAEKAAVEKAAAEKPIKKGGAPDKEEIAARVQKVKLHPSFAQLPAEIQTQIDRWIPRENQVGQRYYNWVKRVLSRLDIISALLDIMNIQPFLDENASQVVLIVNTLIQSATEEQLVNLRDEMKAGKSSIVGKIKTRTDAKVILDEVVRLTLKHLSVTELNPPIRDIPARFENEKAKPVQAPTTGDDKGKDLSDETLISSTDLDSDPYADDESSGAKKPIQDNPYFTIPDIFTHTRRYDLSQVGQAFVREARRLADRSLDSKSLERLAVEVKGMVDDVKKRSEEGLLDLKQAHYFIYRLAGHFENGWYNQYPTLKRVKTYLDRVAQNRHHISSLRRDNTPHFNLLNMIFNEICFLQVNDKTFSELMQSFTIIVSKSQSLHPRYVSDNCFNLANELQQLNSLPYSNPGKAQSLIGGIKNKLISDQAVKANLEHLRLLKHLIAIDARLYVELKQLESMPDDRTEKNPRNLFETFSDGYSIKRKIIEEIDCEWTYLSLFEDDKNEKVFLPPAVRKKLRRVIYLYNRYCRSLLSNEPPTLPEGY